MAPLTLFLLFPFLIFGQTTTYYETAQSSSTSYAGGSGSATATTYSTSSSITPLVLPTAHFTGQALLVGTCLLPQFTVLHFPDGGSLEVPLIGCSDDRPDCCPSLNTTSPEPEETGSEQESESDAATTSWTATTPSPLPTGIVSMLSKAPLTVCPSDMVDLDPVCCPVGYKQYGQAIIGGLPCVSTLTSSSIMVPSTVLASISSAVAESQAASTSSAAPSVTVIINQVFAIGLPCADDGEEKASSGLSTGAKAGIGAGVGVAGVLAIVLLWFCLVMRHRKNERVKKEIREQTLNPTDPKNMSVSTVPTSSVPGMYASPQMQHQMMSPQMQMPYGGVPPQGYGPYSPPFGYPQPQGQGQGQYPYPYASYPDMQGIHSMGIPGMMSPGSNTSGSPPPPPFYAFGVQHPPQQKAAEMEGSEVAAGGDTNRRSEMATTQVVSGTTSLSGAGTGMGKGSEPAGQTGNGTGTATSASTAELGAYGAQQRSTRAAQS